MRSCLGTHPHPTLCGWPALVATPRASTPCPFQAYSKRPTCSRSRFRVRARSSARQLWRNINAIAIACAYRRLLRARTGTPRNSATLSPMWSSSMRTFRRVGVHESDLVTATQDRSRSGRECWRHCCDALWRMGTVARSTTRWGPGAVGLIEGRCGRRLAWKGVRGVFLYQLHGGCQVRDNG